MSGGTPLLEATRHLYDAKSGRMQGSKVASVIRDTFPTFVSAVGSSSRPCICDSNDSSISHDALRQLLYQFSPRGRRVGILLPNGALLAVVIVATANRAIAIPLNPSASIDELQQDIVSANMDELIVLADDHSMDQFCADRGMICTHIVPTDDAIGFRVVHSTAAPIVRPLNELSDACLLLFTSGTTGNKKQVEHSVCNVLVASCIIAHTWNLQPSDTVCNLMPLFHIGGILRQVVAPIVSGGAVICCETVDASLFWELLSQQRFTWYYAAPTIHQLLLEANPNRENPYTLRMVANAAGGLLPSLAVRLRETYQCVVLPSYGMTECMPIASPPAHYQLEKPGTSGVPVGPELGIFDAETERELPVGAEGAICVRGDPCFQGYVGEEASSSSSFLSTGWFNTGDIGYVDADGYLYITGRSKEVINRGGEIISPLEVEEAVNQHPHVNSCLAFSTLHSVLQETVGIVIVPTNPDKRIDLPTLHEFLSDGRLANPKWPQCMVFADTLPKSLTNKLLRVQLGKRLSIPEIHDTHVSWVERTFEAKCPAPGTPLTVAIPCQRVPVSSKRLEYVLSVHQISARVEQHSTKVGALVVYVPEGTDRLEVIRIAKEMVHRYEVPSHICYDRGLPPQPSDALAAIQQESVQRGPTDALVLELQEQMQAMLQLDCLPAPETNFFNLGGSSMLASQLASRMRKIHNIPFSGAEIFHISSCNDIANAIRERKGLCEGGSESVAVSSFMTSSYKPDFSKTPFESTRLAPENGIFAKLVQLLPALFLYPLFQLVRFFLFFRSLLWISHTFSIESRALRVVLTLVVFHTVWTTATPLAFVIIKWLMIGKYKKGRYPIYSSYYLRWWLCDVVRRMIGKGIWSTNSTTLVWYYRMLGATIGQNVHIHTGADIAEFDLVTLGDGATIEKSTIRGFAVDNGCMMLGPVTVGSFASVGVESVVAPYTEVKKGFHLGPSASSYESEASNDATPHHLKYNREAYKGSSMWSRVVAFYPIIFLVEGFSYLPALWVLSQMLNMRSAYAHPFHSPEDLLEWLADTRRIPYYFGLRIAQLIVSPLFYMFAAILVKRLLIGKFRAGPRDIHSDWQILRFELAAELFRQDKMDQVAHLIGRHHELVSVLYRLLGAKIGKRVFWPGTQPTFSGEFDLLEIGDDVVFGSKSVLICTTVDSAERIILCAGSNVADSTVVLPGGILGKNAVIGSNTVCPSNRYLPEASVWCGARNGEPVLLEKGEHDTQASINASEVKTTSLQMIGDESTKRPFGKAVYDGETNYLLYPLPVYVLSSIGFQIIGAMFTTAPLLGSLYLSAAFLFGRDDINRAYVTVDVAKGVFFGVLFCVLLAMNLLRLIVWVIAEVVAKKAYIGQRQEGRANWDTSTYSQRWELHRHVAPIRFAGRISLLDLISGTPYMSAFFRLLGCQIGKDCCLFPTGGEPFMIEPDLITMGDRCVVDNAKLVCHLNTRGNFELARIRLEDNVTLRTECRVQQGVVVEEGSMLLEKSLAMTGEVIEPESVWLGIPATRLFSYDTASTIATDNSGDLV